MRRRRWAGGRWARRSYYAACLRAASLALEQAEPYRALRNHVRCHYRAVRPPPQPRRSIDRLLSHPTRAEDMERRARAAIKGPDDYARELGLVPDTSCVGTFNLQDEMVFRSGYRAWLDFLKSGLRQDGVIS